jgi:ABC-type nickel/cobalt efflux system permease component RcnA
VASVIGWLTSREEALSALLASAIGLVAVTLALLVASLWRAPAADLRWDGQAWQLGSMTGNVAVVIDLGPWMLLRFTADAPPRTTWLPVQRRGLEAQWHALRCAVYSPRPVAER